MINKTTGNTAPFIRLYSDDVIFSHDPHDDYNLLGQRHAVPVTRLPFTFLGQTLRDTPNDKIVD